MWGFISTEACYQTNFNTSFSSSKSDVLIHLAQWQYWWWFWFAFLWSFYYFFINKTIRFRVIKMKPKISTSFKPHGKWGDFLAAIIPVIWCLNILTNSNYILRLLEWQSENSLITIRVRARQWYWIYKIDLKNFFLFKFLNKNIANNNWSTNSFSSNNHNKNVSLLLQKNFNRNLNIFWKDYNNKIINIKKNSFFLLDFNKIKKNYCIKFNFKLKNYYFFNLIYKKLKNININNYQNYQKNYFFDSFDNSRILKKKNGENLPFRLFNGNILLKQLNSTLFLFFYNFNKKNNFFFIKNSFNSDYFVLKQKKYTKKNLLSINSNLINNKYFIKNNNKNIIHYELLKKNKYHDDIINLPLNKRLLRTQKILILPSHINISIITSSFDVIHSWFIPGLGLKLDCVPGRSTHHSFYIDNYGFYFGQCAEICGRYHHHMPIRICAIPYEHFLIWWQNFGLSRILKNELNIKQLKNYIFKKYMW